MITPEKPKPIALRKTAIVVAFLLFIPLILLIFYNVSQSTSGNTRDSKTDSSQTLASEADTNWYQLQTIKKTSTKKPTTLRTNSEHPPVQTAAMTEIVTPQPAPITPELQEAMRAPITSNQLVGESSVNGRSTQTSLNQTTESHSDANNQNEQSEKKVFVQTSQSSQNNVLNSSLEGPITPYELQAGSLIPAILMTGINSDLPGQITAQVRSTVYDSISGNSVVIPQGAKLTGLYDSQIAYGQERVLVVWKRIIFPNGKSIDLEGMPGVDLSGYAGFKDRVNNHYAKLAGSVLLMSVLGAGAQLSQPQNNDSNVNANPSVSQTIAQSMGTNVVNTAAMLTNKNMNIQPTLEIQPGYEFNVSVTKDMVFPAPYR